MTTITLLKSKIYEKILLSAISSITIMIALSFFLYQSWSPFRCKRRERNIHCYTSKVIQEQSSRGSSSIEFLERSHFEMSLEFQTSEGTAVKPSPANESSCKYNYSWWYGHQKRRRNKWTFLSNVALRAKSLSIHCSYQIKIYLDYREILNIFNYQVLASGYNTCVLHTFVYSSSPKTSFMSIVPWIN